MTDESRLEEAVRKVAQKVNAYNAVVDLLNARTSLEQAYRKLYSTVIQGERMELEHDIRELIVQVNKLMERVDSYSKK